MVNLGEKRWCNFRKKGMKAPKGKSAADKRPGMSAKHLEAIRKLPCLITGRMPAGEAHHLKGTGERGIGLRSTDKWAVPLCHAVHMELEGVGSRNELAWFQGQGGIAGRVSIEDPHALADALWHASPDIARMTRIVIEHRGK